MEHVSAHDVAGNRLAKDGTGRNSMHNVYLDIIKFEWRFLKANLGFQIACLLKRRALLIFFVEGFRGRISHKNLSRKLTHRVYLGGDDGINKKIRGLGPRKVAVEKRNLPM